MSGSMDELLPYLLGNSPALRASLPTAADLNPLVDAEAGSLPSYQVPLRRSGPGDAFWYPGFGVDPERAGGLGAIGPTAPTTPGGTTPTTPTGGGGALQPAPIAYTSPGGGGGAGAGIGGLVGLLALRGGPALMRYLAGRPSGLPADLEADLAYLYGDDGAGTATEPPAAIDENSPMFDPLPTGTGSEGFFAGSSGADPFDPGIGPPSTGQAPGPFDTGGDLGIIPGAGSPDFAAGIVSGGGGDLLSAGFPNAGAFEGLGPDLGASLPQVGAPLGSTQIGPFTINPASIGAGAIGSFAGTTLARSLVEGDPGDQATASSIGGTVGGAAGGVAGAWGLGAALGSWAGPVGVLVGAFLGSLAGGTLFGGDPDLPYAGVAGDFSLADGGLKFSTSSVSAGNGGNVKAASDLGGFLNDYIARTAAERGLVADPAMVNRGGFFAGVYDGELFYRPTYGAEDFAQGFKPKGAAFTGGTAEQLGGRAFEDLLGRGFFKPPGEITPFEKVQAAVGTGWTEGGPLVGIGKEAPVQLEKPQRLTYDAASGSAQAPVGWAHTNPDSGAWEWQGGVGPSMRPQQQQQAQLPAGYAEAASSGGGGDWFDSFLADQRQAESAAPPPAGGESQQQTGGSGGQGGGQQSLDDWLSAWNQNAGAP